MHFVDIWDVEADVPTRVVEVTKRVAEKMASTLNAEGINTFSASGKSAGQEIYHFHIHVHARTAKTNPETPTRNKNSPQNTNRNA